MPTATPAIAFLLMLVAPSLVALWGDRKKKARASAAAAAEDASAAKKGTGPSTSKKVMRPSAPSKPFASASSVPATPESASISVFTPPSAETSPAASTPHSSASRIPQDSRDPYAAAANLYAQPSTHYVDPTAKPQTLNAEDLLAQAAAARERAATLAAAARAAQAKAQAAAEAANHAARVAAQAHRAAATERNIQAQITAQEQARTASGEHDLPETHPSLDFPRSGKPRRAA